MTGHNDHKLLTPEKILHILRTSEKTDDVIVVESNLKAGTEKGDNYSGELIACNLKARVNGVDKDYHWMVKMPLLGPSLSFERLNKMEEKEIMFYGSFLPKLKKFVSDRGSDIQLGYCPVLYTEFHEDVDKGSIIVMENLQRLKYCDAPDKKKGLTLPHVKLAMEEMARLHAVSYAYLKSYPGGIEEGVRENLLMTRDYIFSNPEAEVQKMMMTMEKLMMKTINDMTTLAQEPGQNFVGIMNDFDAKCDGGIWRHRERLLKPDPKGFNVLCHGDTWFNNMLFRYGSDDVTPESVCMLDLALTRYSNPCGDLAYFLYVSTTPQLRRTHLEDFLECYHNCLISCLHQLGEDPAVYPYRLFRKDYDKYSFHGLLSAMMLLPVMLMKKEDAVDSKEIKESMMDPSKSLDEESFKMFNDAAMKAYANEPQIKIMMAGNFLESLENGSLAV